MTWRDDGVHLSVQITGSGDFVDPLRQTEIPIMWWANGEPPIGWTKTFANDLTATMANYSVVGQTFRCSSAYTNTNTKNFMGIRYRINTPTIGHNFMFSGEVAGWQGLESTTWVTAAADLYQANGFPITSTASQFKPFPDGQFQTFVNITGAIPANCAYINVSIYGRLLDTVTGNTSPWAWQLRNVWFTDLDAPRPTISASDWYDVECDSMSADIHYGRARFTERYDVGSFELVLNNAKGDYRFSNVHPQGFRPGRMVRLTAWISLAWFPLAFGVIRSIDTRFEIDGTTTVTLRCLDTTSFASEMTTPSIKSQYSNVYSGHRIGYLCDYVGIPDSYRAIAQGDWHMKPVTQSARPIREEIGVTADSEGSYFFAERDGKVRYYARSWPDSDTRLTEVQANIVAAQDFDPVTVDNIPTRTNAPTVCPRALEADWTSERVINQITLAIVGGTTSKFDNEESQGKYGVRTYQRLDYLVDIDPAAKLEIRANDIFATSLDAMLRLKRITVRPTNPYPVWQFCLQAFMQWLIRVYYVHPVNNWGWATVVRIQSVDMRITPTDWLVEFGVDEPQSFVELSIADAGWDIGLWDINIWDEGYAEPVPNEGAYWDSGQTWDGIGVTWLA